MEKRIKIKKYSKHPEMEGDKLEVTIMNSEKIKPRMKSKIAPRKPKQPRMTVAQLAMTVSQLAIIVNNLAIDVNNLTIEMRAGFAEIKATLARHEEIFKRNNLK
jgi:hypothetical protein